MIQTTPKVIVAVSPFYRGLGWKDEGTGIIFKADALMKHYSIPKTRDLSGIAKQIHLNNLILIEGDLEIPDIILDPEDEIQNLESKITQLNGQVSTLENDKANLENDKTQLNSQISTLESDKTNLQNQIQLLEQEVQELQDIIDNFDEGVEGFSVTDEVYTEETANALTVAEIKAELDRLEIEYPAGALKPELVSLLIGQPL